MGNARLNPDRGNFDKWQMFRLLEGENIGPCHIPATNLLSEDTLNHFLTDYHRVYIKPVDTWGGHGISLVETADAEIWWTLQGERPQSVGLDDIIHHYEQTPAIVQQAIPLVPYRGHPCDIRVHMQRDIDENWVYAGELVRVGGNGIVSNVEISQGVVVPFPEAMFELFQADEGQIQAMKQSLAHIGTCICHFFNAHPHIDEVGIDLAVDSAQHLWLIEVNTNDAMGAPSQELFDHLPDKTMYHEIVERCNARQSGILELFFDSLGESFVENE